MRNEFWQLELEKSSEGRRHVAPETDEDGCPRRWREFWRSRQREASWSCAQSFRLCGAPQRHSGATAAGAFRGGDARRDDQAIGDFESSLDAGRVRNRISAVVVGKPKH